MQWYACMVCLTIGERRKAAGGQDVFDVDAAAPATSLVPNMATLPNDFCQSTE